MNEEMMQFWETVGLVIVHVSDGDVIVGRIIEVATTVITMRDIHGYRHWISQDAISRIQELGENHVK